MKLIYRVAHLYVFTFMSKKGYYLLNRKRRGRYCATSTNNVLLTVHSDLEINILDPVLKQVDKHMQNRILINKEQKPDNGAVT